MFNDFKFSDVVTESVAVNVCGNCGASCDTLIDLPSWNFKACATCAEEAAREDAYVADANRKAREAARFDAIACIGNGLYVRTGSGKKRRSR